MNSIKKNIITIKQDYLFYIRSFTSEIFGVFWIFEKVFKYKYQKVIKLWSTLKRILVNFNIWNIEKKVDDNNISNIYNPASPRFPCNSPPLPI